MTTLRLSVSPLRVLVSCCVGSAHPGWARRGGHVESRQSAIWRPCRAGPRVRRVLPDAIFTGGGQPVTDGSPSSGCVEYELGVLFVHGIGQQRRFETLVRFGDPLTDYLEATRLH